MTDHESGSTVTEVMVVLAISGIVTVALITALSSGLRTERSISAELDHDRRSATVAGLISRDLRRSTLDPVAVGSGSMDESLTLTSINETGSVESVRWWLDRGVLTRASTDQATGRSGEVQFGTAAALAVEYIDGDQRALNVSAAAELACVRLVRVAVEFAVSEDPVTVAVAPRSFSKAEPC